MSGFVRNLTFRCENLGAPADLVLTFDDQPIPGIYKDYYPSAFAVRKFPAEDKYYTTVTYRAQLAFTKVIVSNDIIQGASTEKAIGLGQLTKLTKSDDIFRFSEPVADSTVPKKNIACQNDAPFKEDIGIGFIPQQGADAITSLLWQGVGSGYKLNAEFTPVMRGYIGTGYQANAVIRGQISSGEVFKQDLAGLPENTNWKLDWDPATGRFSIERIS